MLGLRTADGVATDLLAGWEGWEAAAEPLVAEGLLRQADDRVAPTRLGLLHADGLARTFACLPR